MRIQVYLLASAAALVPAAALAQATPQTLPPPDSAVAPAPTSTPVGTKRVYTPADFARFAPKTAYDMLVQVPGFSIRSADQERGLGQASENVLVNGKRIANKSYGGGAGGATDELQRTPISKVQRIEIVDAASLGIAGLSGQVANVILTETKKASGQFEWRPDFRAHFAKPRLFAGNVSYSSKTGPVDYTLSITNNTGRGGLGGPIIITDRNGNVIETRNEIFHSESELVTFQTKLGIDGPGSSVGNLTLGYTPYWAPSHIYDDRTFATGETRHRSTITQLDGWYYDINADYEFALGPGRLKLIGLHHMDHEPVITTQILHFDVDDHDEGVRFSRDSHIGETIGRAEYHWKTGKNDWQVTFERAFNSLDQKGGLAILDEDGEFVDVPFPEGTGRVTEVRYEGIATLSRPLSSSLDLQLAGGAEISHLDRSDDDAPARKFFRPTGSLTLGWRPAKSWDVNFNVRRRVGQISFYDFLAQPQLSQDRENAGNPDLVPPQSWEFETEVSHDLGRWGQTKLKSYLYLVDDIIDIIPLANHGEGIGNLPHATRLGFESTSTINFDPIGWTGAKVDLSFGAEKTSVKDPLTGERRALSGEQDYWVSASLRHDIPHTDFAWGASFEYSHNTPTYFLTEVGRNWEGPNWVGLFVEDKDVFGLTVRAQVGNILNARHRFSRTKYVDWRNNSPVEYYQENNQLIGPIFSFLVKGSF